MCGPRLHVKGLNHAPGIPAGAARVRIGMNGDMLVRKPRRIQDAAIVDHMYAELVLQLAALIKDVFLEKLQVIRNEFLFAEGGRGDGDADRPDLLRFCLGTVGPAEEAARPKRL